MNSEKEALDLPAIVTGNGEAYPKQWLAVYVRLYHEKKTSARLNTMGIENFLPIQEEIHQWSDRRKKISRVLIPMIVFVHVEYLQPIITQYFIDNKSEIWLLFLIAHSKR